jgi:hypothetical protein
MIFFLIVLISFNQIGENNLHFWCHFSQVSIHRVFQASRLIEEGQFAKASSILEDIPYGHIRHGYREFIELYVSFFKLKIAERIGEPTELLLSQFQRYRLKINYPIFIEEYFTNYFPLL